MVSQLCLVGKTNGDLQALIFKSGAVVDAQLCGGIKLAHQALKVFFSFGAVRCAAFVPVKDPHGALPRYETRCLWNPERDLPALGLFLTAVRAVWQTA